MAERVEKRTAFALPVFNMERLAWVKPILLASSPELIFLFASITSKFTIIAIIYTVKSFSFFILVPYSNALLIILRINHIKPAAAGMGHPAKKKKHKGIERGTTDKQVYERIFRYLTVFSVNISPRSRFLRNLNV